MKVIIAQLKIAEEEKSNGDIESNAHAEEHAAVRKAITKGMLQPHGSPPDTKQDGIF